LGLLFQVVVVVVVFLLLGPGGGAEPPKAADPSLDDTVPSGGEGDAHTRKGRRRHRPLVASSADAMMARIDDGWLSRGRARNVTPPFSP
jgi:hypothetical protein